MAWTICLSDADISTQTLAYTVAAGSEARLSASFTNRSTSATATATLWVVPSGETVGNEHLKESGTTLGLAGTSQAVLERSFVAPAGAKVYVQASTANVSCQVQGDVVSVDGQAFSDGTSSITYGTNWANSGQTSLKKDANGICTLYLTAYLSGSSSGTMATLPSGYRPPSNVLVSGVFYKSLVYYPAYFIVASTGQISGAGIPTGSTADINSSGSIIYLNLVYST